MRRSLSRSWAGLSCVALLASGCGFDPFGPPSRPKAPPSVAESDRTKPIFLVYVVPGTPSGDVEMWGVRAQHEANLHRAVFRIMGPGPGSPSGGQPEIVRKALTEGASALIVYAGDSPELSKVLAEAEAKGVPVVLIDKPLAAPEGVKPFTLVEPAPFEESARQIVAGTVADLKKVGRGIEGTALLLVNQLTDRTSPRRVAALKSAAEAAKFPKIVEVPFEGSSEESVKRSVLEAVKANPDVSVVLASDAEGFHGAAIVRAELLGKPVFFVGGCMDFRTSPIVMAPVRESCYADGHYSELGALAVTSALAKLRGQDVGEHAYVKPLFVKLEGAVASEADAKGSVPAIKKAEYEADNERLLKQSKGAAKP